jgi:tripartite-type tricarboxylate transporter receptor subunit TctC
MTNIRHAAAAAVAALCLAASTARADAVADFYSGRTVTLVVANAAGGIYSLFGQMFQRHFPDHMAGHPKVVLSYMTGAGGVRAANYVYNAAPRDGSMLALLSTGIATTPVLEPEKVKYDAAKLSWLGSFGDAVNVLSVMNTAPAKTIEEAKTKVDVIGALGKGSPTYQVPHMLNAILGTKFKLVLGYTGGGPVRLAMEKGEVDGFAGQLIGWLAAKPEWVREGRIVHLVQLASRPSPELKGVPVLTDLARNEEERQIFRLASPGITAFTLTAPPGVPADRLGAVEKAFAAMLRDQAFRADAKKRNFPVDPVSAKEVREAVRQLTSIPKPVVAKARKAMGLD